MRAEGKKNQWVVDEPAAKIVKYIYKLCLSGLGPTQIANRLESEKVLIPTAHFLTTGLSSTNP